jgi:hypothetical protein
MSQLPTGSAGLIICIQTPLLGSDGCLDLMHSCAASWFLLLTSELLRGWWCFCQKFWATQ